VPTQTETPRSSGAPFNAPIDVVLIGGGIMSATLATLISEVEPDWTVRILERMDRPPVRAPARGTTPAPATPPCAS
jgi:2-polyprenyl-6-methoxyphenol hydroxylase-like FAD-dependent oxidoreductase